MRSLFQSLATGELKLQEASTRRPGATQIQIRTEHSLLSSGTERMLLEFGRSGYLAKARQQPEKVKQVLQKLRTDGLAATYRAVRSKLDFPITPGYCNVGIVDELGGRVSGFSVGDRVVSNGAHAEVVTVGALLAARVPDGVAADEATFAVPGAIALQGVRLLKPELGECFVVYGLGLLGMLGAQILQASGARVLGVDISPERVKQATALGIQALALKGSETAAEAARDFSARAGVDGVLITAATSGDEILHDSASMCRKGGRIVLTGVCDLHLRRADFYEKELSFQVSCSYGPGRYESQYEEQGIDYPLHAERWTVQRNLESVLRLMSYGKLQIAPLIDERYPFSQYDQAYESVISGAPLAVLLDYPQRQNTRGAETQFAAPKTVVQHERGDAHREPTNTGAIAVIGAGEFARSQHLPNLHLLGVVPKWISSGSGEKAAATAEKFDCAHSTTDNANILSDDEVEAVLICSRDRSHGRLVQQALMAKKKVFVEKPLCTELAELDAIVSVLQPDSSVMVGFNRRFAPLIQTMREHLQGRTGPCEMLYTCNAGILPESHWTLDAEHSAGRIIGEACHFVDLMQSVSGALVQSVSAQSSSAGGRDSSHIIQLRFTDGSIGSISYLVNGAKSFPKEEFRVFNSGKVLELNNFRELSVFSEGKVKRHRNRAQDKGHLEEMRQFLGHVREGTPTPISVREIINSALTCFAAVESAKRGGEVFELGEGAT